MDYPKTCEKSIFNTSNENLTNQHHRAYLLVIEIQSPTISSKTTSKKIFMLINQSNFIYTTKKIKVERVNILLQNYRSSE